MPYRKMTFLKDQCYHVFNRGKGKRRMFHSEKDYQRFLMTMRRYLAEFEGIELLSYCLLPNHFHLILKPGLSGPGLIPGFMRKVQQSYATYYRFRYSQDGAEAMKFEGRYKCKTLLSEHDLATCTMYVTYNAVKHNIVSDAKDWVYSSLVPGL